MSKKGKYKKEKRKMPVALGWFHKLLSTFLFGSVAKICSIDHIQTQESLGNVFILSVDVLSSCF